VPWRADAALPSIRQSRLAPDHHFMRMVEVDGESNAETHFELLEARDGWARLGLSPVTGRRHQLRVHCAAIGMPIRNDAIYPELLPEGSDDFDRPLQLLARQVEFIDPLTGAARRFTSLRSLAMPAA